MNRRVLILGPTGVEKSAALSILKSYSHLQPCSPQILTIDFEKDFILTVNRVSFHTYLDSDKKTQREYWYNAWNTFAESHLNASENRNSTLCLSLHAVLTRPLYGTRSPLNFQSLLEFCPIIVITLIDDIYSMYHRTEARAAGFTYRGRPNLEQLLDARRSEIFLGDFIASHIKPPAEHYVLAIQHPVRTLFRLLFGQNLRRIYLSFPITGPRELLQQGDHSGIQEVNSFLRVAYDFESRCPQTALFCPLGIDEFPLLNTIEACDSEEIDFPMNMRWKVQDYCREQLLVKNLPSSIRLSRDQIVRSSGLIRADVALRDYRLVQQSHFLAVFNPWFNGKLSKGVRNEIRLAIRHTIPVHIFQDRKHDPNCEAVKTLKEGPGSLGDEPGSEYVSFHSDITSLFETILNT